MRCTVASEAFCPARNAAGSAGTEGLSKKVMTATERRTRMPQMSRRNRNPSTFAPPRPCAPLRVAVHFPEAGVDVFRRINAVAAHLVRLRNYGLRPSGPDDVVGVHDDVGGL